MCSCSEVGFHEPIMRTPEKNLFSEELWREIVNLVDDLNISQKQWLGKHLASFSGSPENDAHQTDGRCVVAYGSETGNSRAIAEKFVEVAIKQGKEIELLNLAEAKLRHLSSIKQLFIVCSTHGDGDPPEPIESFYKALLSSEKSLEHLSYALLALGDSTYEKFCESGIQIDEKLSQLSASRLLERVDCDVDFQEQAEAWIEQALSFVNVVTVQSPQLHLVQPSTGGEEVSKSNPVEVEVLENICLSEECRQNRIHHLELDIQKVANFTVQPGDSIGVLPHNPPELVNKILTLLNLNGDESVSVKNIAMPLVQALREHFDLVVVSTKFLKSWANICGSNELLSITEKDNREIREFLKRHHLTDILVTYRAEIDAESLIKLLRPLQPRLYDVANSLKHTPGELHLTIERYFYQMFGREFAGIASNYLIDLDESELISIFPQKNKRFHLPSNPSVPIILVADGTGIAPYRAFIQELGAVKNRQNPAWLILREQQFLDDFLYQTEWQKALDAGELTRVDTVFYRDEPTKTFLDVVAENYELFKGWLDAGAHLYLSGHKFQLEEFESSLGAGLCSDPGVTGVWKAMLEQGRVHRNLY